MKKTRNVFPKNLRYLCLVGVIALGFMTIVATGGGGSGGDSGDSVEEITIEETSIFNESGGFLEITDVNSPIYGTKVVIPEGAIPSGQEQEISVGYIKNLQIPISSSFQLGHQVYIERNSNEDFLIPIEITIDYDLSLSPDGTNILPCYYDKESQKLFPMTVKDIDASQNRITFFALHTSIFTLVYSLFSDYTEVYTSFQPDQDGWLIRNIGDYLSPGLCAGMSFYSVYHYHYRPSDDLFCSYKEGLTESSFVDVDLVSLGSHVHIDYYDDRTAFEIAHRLQWSLLNYIERGIALVTIGGNLANILYSGLYIGNPMVLMLTDATNPLVNGHAVVVYAFEPLENTRSGYFYIYDPNYPGESRKIKCLNLDLDIWDTYDGRAPRFCTGGIEISRREMDNLYLEAKDGKYKTESELFPLIMDLKIHTDSGDIGIAPMGNEAIEIDSLSLGISGYVSGGHTNQLDSIWLYVYSYNADDNEYCLTDGAYDQYIPGSRFNFEDILLDSNEEYLFEIIILGANAKLAACKLFKVKYSAIPNNQPTASINSPSDGATYTQGDTIIFSGTGEDSEDGPLTGGSLVWFSSRDGQLETGTYFTRDDLSVGTHTITLTATDSQGATGSDSVGITVSSIVNLTVVGSIDTHGSAGSVYVSGSYAFVSDDAGLQLIDVSNPQSPNIISSVNSAGKMYVSGSHVYSVRGYRFYVTDISDPYNPTIVATLYPPYMCADVYVEKPYAYVTCEYNLLVIDISVPTNPTIISSVQKQGNGGGVHISPPYAYVADELTGSGGFQVFDISDPYNPTMVSSLDSGGFAIDVFVSGSYAYVANIYDFQVIDISDPYNPTIVSSINMSSAFSAYPQKVYVSDSHAFVIAPCYYTAPADLFAIDISDPHNPTVVGSLKIGGMDLCVSGNYAYVTDENGFEVIEISN